MKSRRVEGISEKVEIVISRTYPATMDFAATLEHIFSPSAISEAAQLSPTQILSQSATTQRIAPIFLRTLDLCPITLGLLLQAGYESVLDVLSFPPSTLVSTLKISEAKASKIHREITSCSSFASSTVSERKAESGTHGGLN